MRRTVLAVLGLALLGLSPVPAVAEDPAPVVEMWRGGMPDGFTFATVECDVPGASPFDSYYFFADEALVLTGYVGKAVGLSYALTSLSSLTAFEPTVTTYLGDPIRFEVSIPSRGVTGSAFVPGAYIHRWSTTNVFSDVYFTWSDGHGGITRSKLPDYIATHAEAAAPATISLVGGCAPGTAPNYELGKLRLTVDGTERILEFDEPRRPWMLDAHDMDIRYGDSVTLRADIDGDRPPGLPLELWGRATGSTEERLVTTATTGTDGVATATVHPERATRYQWRYSVANDHPTTTSANSVVVGVNLGRVSLRVPHRTLRHGHRATAVVSVAPCVGQVVVIRKVYSRITRERRRLPDARPQGCRVRIKFELPRPGRWRVDATVRSTAGVRGDRTAAVGVRVVR
jgi:hypothetical protein